MHKTKRKKRWNLELVHFNPRRLRRLRPAARVMNRLLMVAGPGVCAVGLLSLIWRGLPQGCEKGSLVLWAIGVLADSSFHELGHLVSAVAYKCPVYGAGIFWEGCIPVGGYVSMARFPHSRQQVQMSLAGIEADLLFSGCCFLQGAFRRSGNCCVLGLITLGLALNNLLPEEEKDGDEALSDLLGVASIAATAKIVLGSAERRKRLRRKPGGHAALAILVAVRCTKLVSAALCVVVVVLGLRIAGEL